MPLTTTVQVSIRPAADETFPCLFQDEDGNIALATSKCAGTVIASGAGWPAQVLGTVYLNGSVPFKACGWKRITTPITITFNQ